MSNSHPFEPELHTRTRTRTCTREGAHARKFARIRNNRPRLILGTLIVGSALLSPFVWAGCATPVVLLSLKTSKAYATSRDYVTAHPGVRASVGVPPTDGLFPLGRVHVDPSGGESQLRFHVSGPRGEGVALVSAQATSSGWYVVQATFQKDGTTYDISPGPIASLKP